VRSSICCFTKGNNFDKVTKEFFQVRSNGPCIPTPLNYKIEKGICAPHKPIYPRFVYNLITLSTPIANKIWYIQKAMIALLRRTTNNYY